VPTHAHPLPWLALLAIAAIAGASEPIVERGVVYGSAGGTDLVLDCARPAGDGPFPGVVLIHGGGWTSGSRSLFAGALAMFAHRGYVAIAIDYRLAPRFRFPAQIDDARGAVRWLRGGAARLHLDPRRVAALGDSAGGHLALLLGLMDEDQGERIPAKVQAVVNWYGPTDLGAADIHSAQATAIIERFLGTADPLADIVRRASPIRYVDAKDPPVLTLQGSADPLVPASQARELHAALEKAGVEQRLEIIEGAAHGFAGADLARALGASVDFLDRHLAASR
jgi:acetyl esterase/lipase